ncbi:MAG: GAF domain-containing protein [Chloroflexota bacterium]
MADLGSSPSNSRRSDPTRSAIAPGASVTVALDSEQLRQVRALAVGLHATRSLDELLDRALEALERVTGADRTFVALLDDARTEVRGRRGRGIAPDTVVRIAAPVRRTAAADSGIISTVVHSGAPALLAMTDPFPQEYASPAFGPYSEALTVPLVGPGGTLGTVTSAWQVSTRPRAGAEELALIMTDHLAAAVDARRRIDLERRERTIAEELHTLAQRITAGLSLDSVLASVLRAAEKLLNASSASVFLGAPGGGVSPRRFTTRNTGVPHWDDHVRTRQSGVTATVLRTGEPAVIEDTFRDLRTRGVGDGDSRTFVAMPIRYQDQILGVLYVDWHERRKVSSGDLRLVETLATYGAVAVQNARLLEEAVEAARFDGVLLAARTVAHEINNDLALVMGMAEIAQMQARAGHQPDPAILDDVIHGAQRIANHVRQLQGVVRVEQRHVQNLPPLLDLEQSSE